MGGKQRVQGDVLMDLACLEDGDAAELVREALKKVIVQQVG